MESKKVLMFPWLAHGHISPFVELAKRLSKKNFTIYLCSSHIKLENIKPKLSQNSTSNIELIELHIPSLPHLPSHMHTTNGLSHHLIPTLFKAFDMSAPYFSTILQTLKPDLLISDIFQPWAAQLASSFNIPSIPLLVVGAVSSTLGVHYLSQNIETETELPFPKLIEAFGHLSSKKNVPELLSSYSGTKTPRERFFQCVTDHEHFSKTILINSFSEIEGKYMDYLSVSLKKKVVPIGPLVQNLGLEEYDQKSDILRWLDDKKPNSTVYVSFGSEYYLDKKDTEELAHGLEMSGVNFIWVLRFPKGERINIEEALPEGFMERLGETRGKVVEWAPQMKILEHSSVGGFLSHCGWNSLLESIVFGVPIIALPMQLDQPSHSIMAQEAGVCVEVNRDAEGNVSREEVAKTIREVMFEKIGESLRWKVIEISQVLEKKEGENIETLVAEFNQLISEVKK